MTVQESNNNNNSIINTKKLSVQVSLNGLSFLVKNSDTNTTSFFKEYVFEGTHTPEEVLFEIEKVFQNPEIKNLEITASSILHDNNLVALVPQSIFQEEALSQYLKLNSKLLPTDYIAFDTIEEFDLVIVYVPFTNINNYFFDLFGSFEYYHTTTQFIQHILRKEKNVPFSKMYVCISDTHFDVLVTKNKTIQLYNRFTYQTPEDFLYYILFIAEQLQLNPEDFPLYLLGKIQKGDALYEIAYTYIRTILFFTSEEESTTSETSALTHPFLHAT